MLCICNCQDMHSFHDGGSRFKCTNVVIDIFSLDTVWIVVHAMLIAGFQPVLTSCLVYFLDFPRIL